MEPKNVTGWNSLGLAYDEYQQNDMALKSYQKILPLDPNCSYAHYNIGMLLVKVDRFRESLVYFDKMIEIDPSEEDAYFGKGCAYLMMHKWDEALMNFEKAIEINPNCSQEAYKGKSAAMLMSQSGSVH